MSQLASKRLTNANYRQKHELVLQLMFSNSKISKYSPTQITQHIVILTPIMKNLHEYFFNSAIISSIIAFFMQKIHWHIH